MYDPQREHRKDFLLGLRIFRPRAKALVVAAHQNRGVREGVSATRLSRVP